MKKLFIGRRNTTILLIGSAILILLVYAIWYAFDYIQTNAVEHKIVRNTTATVIRKEYIQNGIDEWKIYFEIDNFDQIAEPTRSSLLKSESERITANQVRSRVVSKDQYSRIEKGDKLIVGWRWLGKDEIEIVSAGKPF